MGLSVSFSLYINTLNVIADIIFIDFFIVFKTIYVFMFLV